jgi:hypothetical protein
MEVVEEIYVGDCLIVEVQDKSQIIGPNTTTVDLEIKVKFDVMPSYFDQIEHFEQVKAAFGTQITYEYRMKRSFVNKDEKDAVSEQFLESFKKNTLPYLSRPDFPRSLALAKYRDVGKMYHGYSFLPQ